MPGKLRVTESVPSPACSLLALPFLRNPQAVVCSCQLLYNQWCTLFASHHSCYHAHGSLWFCLSDYLCRLLMFRTHSNPQVAEEVMRLHAFLLLCPATRSVATQRTIQQMLHTVRHLSLEVSMTSKPADTTGSACLGIVSSTDDKDQKCHSGGDTGLHDQLSSISMCISAVDEAVSNHHNAAVCLAIWRQVVHLAPPTGKTHKPRGFVLETVSAHDVAACEHNCSLQPCTGIGLPPTCGLHK